MYGFLFLFFFVFYIKIKTKILYLSFHPLNNNKHEKHSNNVFFYLTIYFRLINLHVWNIIIENYDYFLTITTANEKNSIFFEKIINYIFCCYKSYGCHSCLFFITYSIFLTLPFSQSVRFSLIITMCNGCNSALTV
jgi:hypothetical protein